MKEFAYQKEFYEWFNTMTTNMNNHPKFLDYMYSGVIYSMSFKTNRRKSMFYLYKLMDDIKKERLHLYASI